VTNHGDAVVLGGGDLRGRGRARCRCNWVDVDVAVDIGQV
jgi:hypothetical protein